MKENTIKAALAAALGALGVIGGVVAYIVRLNQTV